MFDLYHGIHQLSKYFDNGVTDAVSAILPEYFAQRLETGKWNA